MNKYRIMVPHLSSLRLLRTSELCGHFEFCSLQSTEEKEKEIEKIKSNASLDEPPTSCCQSGCANCVFIVWAEALSKKMQNADPIVTEKILSMIEDPSMKAYLEMELSLRGLKKQ